MTESLIPAREQCVLRYELERWADIQPDKTFAVYESGEMWSYAATRSKAQQLAGALRALGVEQGDTVLSWLPNGPDAMQVWFGCNWMGATYVPLNTAYRGNLLQHVVHNSQAKVMLCHAGLADRLDEIDMGSVETVVVLAGSEPVARDHIPRANFFAGSAPDVLTRPIEPWDIQYIIFTSGTTGPSKGVLIPYYQTFCTGRVAYEGIIDGDDRFMVNLPLFHVGGTGLTACMLSMGGSIAVVEYFRTDVFWDQVDEMGVTSSIMVGAMTPFLLKSTPSPDDAAHPLRMVLMVPLGEDAAEFAERFGVDIYTTFNMTEISSPIMSAKNPDRVGVAGQARAGVDLRVVDDNDCEVATGSVGELIVRTDAPWAMNAGYNHSPEATAKAWRNGWFHTGDAFRVDEDGYYFFVDRMKDAIRRRGENISSFEVEAEVQLHRAVREAAAIGVPSAEGEDEVMVVVAVVEQQHLDPAELIETLRGRMAHFMVPRYVRIVEELPKTPTQKVQKHLLKTEGITADTWDREAAGIKVRRERIGS
jgi:carnitine-CoA ligase